MDKTSIPIFAIGLLAAPAVFLQTAHGQVTGFASVAGEGLATTTGGHGGDTVIVDNQSDLEKYAGSNEPFVILINGSIEVEPFGYEIAVQSNKTIHGMGTRGEIVHGGFFMEAASNVIFRNFTCRDSFLEGDWRGKANDFDCFQMDNCHHIWIDHCHLTRGGDGLIDSRKGTTNLTVSWTILSDHNKAFGIGWIGDVTTEVTIHHVWFRNTHQRNPAADNVLRAHLYNNFMQNLGSYGNHSRGGTNMVLENSVYEDVPKPHFYDNGTLYASGNIYRDVSGEQESTNEKFFEPGDYYDYVLHPAEAVEALLAWCAGPQEDLSCSWEGATSASKGLFRPAGGPGVGSGSAPTAAWVYSLDGRLREGASGPAGPRYRWRASRARTDSPLVPGGGIRIQAGKAAILE